MNKNTVFAFITILAAMLFFQSPMYKQFYNEKILKKQYSDILNNKIEKTIKGKKEKIRTEDNNIEKTDSNIVRDTIINIICIENDKMKIKISEKGAEIVSIEMKEYKNNKTNIPISLINDKTSGAQLRIGNENFNNEIFKCNNEKQIIVVEKNQKIEFINTSKNGDVTKKVFEFNKDSYLINLTIEKDNLPGEKVTIGWGAGINETDIINQKTLLIKRVMHISSGDNFQHIVLKNKEKEGPIAGNFEWIGITEKYFFIAINNDSIQESDINIEAFEDTNKQVNYKYEITRLCEKQKEKFSIYIGPKKREELIRYNKNYSKIFFPVIGWTRIIFWSEVWFPWLAEKVLLLLLFIQSIVKDFGVAIIIITIITKVITYPMTISSMKSIEKMKDIQPKVNKIRTKHKNNPQKMNEEIMDLYKKEGVNPLNPGCLPIFLQMPIFISLYVVLQNCIELRGASTIIIPWIKDLSKPEEILSIASIIPSGIPIYGTNLAILPIINALLTFFQQKKTITDPNQKMLIYFMPIFMLAFFNSFPSGIVLYWTFTSAIQLLQQTLINKTKRIK